MKTAAILFVVASAQLAHAESEPRCAKAAIAQAGKLLAFHFGPDNRIAVEEKVKTLPPIRNPASPKQLFDVLEVQGHIYKGTYRMRLIYARDLPDQCVLMGQEILELAKL